MIFDTAHATWTVKYEAGALQYLRYDDGTDAVYVVSTHRPPAPEPLAEAMQDYPAFVRAYNAFVESLAGVLDGVDTDLPAVASVGPVVAERDRILDRLRDCCSEMASQLCRAEGDDYGRFAVRLDGTRWELKREHDRVAYLRVGGDDGVYLLSRYRAPAPADVRELVGDVPAFVAAFNDHVADLDSTLSGVTL